MDYFDKFYNPDRNIVDVDMLAIILKRECRIKLGHNKLYRLKKQIEYDHPELFGKDRKEDIAIINEHTKGGVKKKEKRYLMIPYYIIV